MKTSSFTQWGFSFALILFLLSSRAPGQMWVVNHTHYKSLLPLRIDAKEYSIPFPEQMVWEVDGKLRRSDVVDIGGRKHVFVDVDLEPASVLPIKITRGQQLKRSSFAVQHDDINGDGSPDVLVDNGVAKWLITADGMTEIEHAGKKYAIKEEGFAGHKLGVEHGEVVCLVKFTSREDDERLYLFYAGSPLWNVRFSNKGGYAITLDGDSTIWLSHKDESWNPFIKTDDVEKLYYSYLKTHINRFYLFYPVDWTIVKDSRGLGLGIFPTAASPLVAVDASDRKRGIRFEVREPAADDVARLKWQPRREHHYCALPYQLLLPKKMPKQFELCFAITEDERAGENLRSASHPLLLIDSSDAGGQFIAKADMDQDGSSERVTIEDRNKNGSPDFAADTWSWRTGDGRLATMFEFQDDDKDGLCDGLVITGNEEVEKSPLERDPNGINPPLLFENKVHLHDWSHDGRFFVNSPFFGGQVHQDWWEYDYNTETGQLSFLP